MQIGVYQAKTHLPELLARVENGEEVTITRHGKAIARLLPVGPASSLDLHAAIAALKVFNIGRTAGMPIRDMIGEGRR